jgi:hypothetical protein
MDNSKLEVQKTAGRHAMATRRRIAHGVFRVH